jgi:hypothetical protein
LRGGHVSATKVLKLAAKPLVTFVAQNALWLALRATATDGEFACRFVNGNLVDIDVKSISTPAADGGALRLCRSVQAIPLGIA